MSGYRDRVVVVSGESSMPYDRPPLSKKFLAGDWDAERVALRKPADLDSLGVEWRLGKSAVALDTNASGVSLSDGESLPYDGLIIATGGIARRLPFQGRMRGVHCLRTLDDAAALREEITQGARVVIIGAGFIGLEAAATAKQRGADVVVLEGLSAPLVRALGEEMGTAIGQVHPRNDVSIRCGVQVDGFEGDDHVTGVRLATGEVVMADVVIVGIGVTPAIDWCESSGLTIRDGIVCDQYLCAGPENVFAAGDVARWPNPLFVDIETDMRVEHWTNAAEQGSIAARNLCAYLDGREQEAYAAVPFFWSDQFDARIQCLGRPSSGADVDIVAGDVSEGRWCAIYSMKGVLTAVLGVSMPKLVMPSRSLLSPRVTRDEALAHFAQATALSQT